MSFKGKMKQGRYALLTAAVLACLGATHGYAAEDAGVRSDKSNFAEGIHVDVDFDKEMLKNAPYTKTTISHADLDRRKPHKLSDALAAEQGGTNNR